MFTSLAPSLYWKISMNIPKLNVRRAPEMKTLFGNDILQSFYGFFTLYSIFFAISINEFVSVKFIPSLYCRGFRSKFQKSISHRVVLQKRAPYQSSMSWNWLLKIVAKWPLIPVTFTLVDSRTVFGTHLINFNDNDMGTKNCPNIKWMRLGSVTSFQQPGRFSAFFE